MHDTNCDARPRLAHSLVLTSSQHPFTLAGSYHHRSLTHAILPTFMLMSPIISLASREPFQPTRRLHQRIDMVQKARARTLLSSSQTKPKYATCSLRRQTEYVSQVLATDGTRVHVVHLYTILACRRSTYSNCRADCLRKHLNDLA